MNSTNHSMHQKTFDSSTTLFPPIKEIYQVIRKDFSAGIFKLYLFAGLATMLLSTIPINNLFLTHVLLLSAGCWPSLVIDWYRQNSDMANAYVIPHYATAQRKTLYIFLVGYWLIATTTYCALLPFSLIYCIGVVSLYFVTMIHISLSQSVLRKYRLFICIYPWLISMWIMDIGKMKDVVAPTLDGFFQALIFSDFWVDSGTLLGFLFAGLALYWAVKIPDRINAKGDYHAELNYFLFGLAQPTKFTIERFNNIDKKTRNNSRFNLILEKNFNLYVNDTDEESKFRYVAFNGLRYGFKSYSVTVLMTVSAFYFLYYFGPSFLDVVVFSYFPLTIVSILVAGVAISSRCTIDTYLKTLWLLVRSNGRQGMARTTAKIVSRSALHLNACIYLPLIILSFFHLNAAATLNYAFAGVFSFLLVLIFGLMPPSVTSYRRSPSRIFAYLLLLGFFVLGSVFAAVSKAAMLGIILCSLLLAAINYILWCRQEFEFSISSANQ